MKKKFAEKLISGDKSEIIALFVERGISLDHLIGFFEKTLSSSPLLLRPERKAQRKDLENLLLVLLETRMKFPMLANIDDGGTFGEIETVSLRRFLAMIK